MGRLGTVEMAGRVATGMVPVGALAEDENSSQNLKKALTRCRYQCINCFLRFEQCKPFEYSSPLRNNLQEIIAKRKNIA